MVEKGQQNEIYNISGGFEQKNKDTVKKIITSFYGKEEGWENYVDLGHVRPGQDVRYSVNDEKIRNLGWKPIKVFDDEIGNIVQHYKENFRW